VNQLDAMLVEWSAAIQNLISTQATKPRVAKGPMGEVEFWREKFQTISTLYEQFNIPDVRKIISTLQIAESQCFPGFRFQMGELTKLYLEAQVRREERGGADVGRIMCGSCRRWRGTLRRFLCRRLG
jgi:dynein heavy chain, axonemal